ncbi:pentapeptide repeat-containing protein [Streptomyces sp. NPDC006655]|uniref:pentapeptide repeat-containing protein n=1 Tax=Streptomyces sp. NPDC006655 TaxID=3156898 RepID=UPI003452406E
MATLVVAASTLISIKQVSSDQALTLEGQITDRYNAAVQNLGSDSQDVRLGGIYALQRIMQDSRRDYPTIVNVLAAYVRAHAVKPEKGGAAPGKSASDVEAAIGVFRTRDTGEASDELVIDLSDTYLRGAHLDGTNLTNADLTGADLAGAHLGEASSPHIVNMDYLPSEATDLSGATLRDANLNHADLLDANLENADLRNADLRRANLESADLFGANLEHADLRGTYLGSTNLTVADLRYTNLTGVDLTTARGLTAADLAGADLNGADLRGVDLRGANLDKTKLTGADLRGANLRAMGRLTPWSPAGETQLDVSALVQARLDHSTKLPARLAKDPQVQKAMAAGSS